MTTAPDEKSKKPSKESPDAAQPNRTTADKPPEAGSPLTAKLKAANDDETIESRPEPKTLQSAPGAEPGAKPRPATLVAPGMGRMNPLPATPALSASGKLLDRKIAYRQWLENKTKDELIDLIINLEAKDPGLEITEKLMKAQPSQPVAPILNYKPPENLAYTRLPVRSAAAASPPMPAWQIVLVNIDHNHPPLGLIIENEITFGRATGDTMPDVDLSPYGASTKGVSRIHARMRPLANNLALVDEKSTNGTFCNKAQIQPGVEHAVNDGDVITFGKVNFMVKIVKSPSAK